MSLEQTNLDGKRPLHDAAQFSKLECVKYLVGQGKIFTDEFPFYDSYHSPQSQPPIDDDIL